VKAQPKCLFKISKAKNMLWYSFPFIFSQKKKENKRFEKKKKKKN
jgi:hypothetical protein